MTESKLEFSVNEKWQKFAIENSWAYFIPETAKDEFGFKYLRRRGNEIIYKETEKGYQCNTCGSKIAETQIAHPIHDAPFSLSGSGKCHYEDVPYCPNCEEKPNFNGVIITC